MKLFTVNLNDSFIIDYKELRWLMFFLIFSIKAAIGSGLLIETGEFLSSMSSINKNYLPENQRLHIFTNLLVDNVGNRTVNFKVHD